jgi:tRNA (guanine-N7-)-methyltransferase
MSGDARPRLYIRRRGRMTRAQARALESLYERHCLPATGEPIDDAAWFGRDAPLALEVGFGMGHALVHLAATHPDWNCIGIEIYRPGIGALLNRCEGEGIDNVRILEGDARAALAQRIRPRSLQRVHVFFPDPWPKSKHHKRRLIEAGFVQLLVSRMRVGGRLLLATDWEDYAEWMLAVLNGEPRLRNLDPAGRFASAPEDRPSTRFAERGIRLGLPVRDLAFEVLA